MISLIIYLLGNGLLRYIKRFSDRKMTFISIHKVTTDLCSVVDMIWVASITLDLVPTYECNMAYRMTNIKVPYK